MAEQPVRPVVARGDHRDADPEPRSGPSVPRSSSDAGCRDGSPRHPRGRGGAGGGGRADVAAAPDRRCRVRSPGSLRCSTTSRPGRRALGRPGDRRRWTS
ncbi:hypothetical protein HBB16_04715 [Pseudonocardia sp. MCCB 268]|nr:hypothetical protein [Pseudonocardia cytotoxica]